MRFAHSGRIDIATSSRTDPVKSTTRRVIIIVEAPFVQRDYERFGVSLLVRTGFDVEVWDISQALQPWMTKADPTPTTGVSVREFTSQAEVCRAIRTAAAAHTLFLCLVGYRLKSATIYITLGRTGARYALLQAIGHPASSDALDSSILKRLQRVKLSSIAGSVFVRIAPRLLGVAPPEVVIAGGKRSITANGLRLIGPKTRVLWAHSLDYDQFLKIREEPALPQGQYAVFIDQFLSAHPDQVQQGERFCNPLTYFANLRRAFDDLERALGIEVVIAAHPQSDYRPQDPRFAGRRIVFGDTGRLIKSASMVLTHDSTAITFAVLFRKPVTFLTDNGVWSSRVRRESAVAMSSALGKVVINVEGTTRIPWVDELSYSEDRYGSYAVDFIKRAGTPDLPLWEIVANYLAADETAVSDRI